MSDDSIVQQLLPRPPWRLHADFVRGQRRRVAMLFALALARAVDYRSGTAVLLGLPNGVLRLP